MKEGSSGPVTSTSFLWLVMALPRSYSSAPAPRTYTQKDNYEHAKPFQNESHNLVPMLSHFSFLSRRRGRQGRKRVSLGSRLWVAQSSQTSLFTTFRSEILWIVLPQAGSIFSCCSWGPLSYPKGVLSGRAYFPWALAPLLASRNETRATKH